MTTHFPRAGNQGMLFASGTADRIGKTLANQSVKLIAWALDEMRVWRGIGAYRIWPRPPVQTV